MTKPLSYLEYFKGNKKKALSLVISIAFSIFLIGSIQMFLDNTIATGDASIKQYNKFSLVESEEGPIDKSFIEKLNSNQNIERIIPIQLDLIPYRGIATLSYAESYFMDREDIGYLIDYFEIDIDKNQIPNNDENKIILSESLMKNNDFKERDRLSENSTIEIAKSFESDYLLALVATTIDPDTQMIMVVPKEGMLEEVNKFIYENNKGFLITGIESWAKLVDEVVEDVNQLFNIIIVIVLITIGIGLGISTYVHYYQRRREFAIMNAMGYKAKNVLMKINKEILINTLLAFILGFCIIYVEMFLINKLVLESAGTPLFVVNISLMSKVVVIPLFTLTFSLIPTWILLKKIDSISMIEGA